MNKVTVILAALAVVMFGTSTFAAMDHMDLGGDIKVLGYYGENVADFSDDSEEGFSDQDSFIRTEAHLWFSADLSDNVMTKISVEVDRRWDGQSYEGTYYEYPYSDYDLSSVGSEGYAIGSSDDLEVFLEEAFIQMSQMYDSSFNLKLGRQFIQLGDGFVVGDADPFSEFTLNTKGEYEVDPFDAIFGWFDGEDWVLDLIYAKVAETGTMRDDSDVWIAYFTYSGMENFAFDLYFLYANIETDALLSSYSYAGVDDSDLFAVGGRISGTAVEGLSYKLEGLYEFGEVETQGSDDDGDLSAWAIEAGLKYVFESDYNPWIEFTYVFESGDDDLEDGDIDAFIPLFENRTYGEILDGFTSSNVHVFNLGGGFNITPELSLYGKYYYIMAAEDQVYGEDDEIGHEFDAYLDYTITEEATAMLAGGFVSPGDAIEYLYGEDDSAYFVRAGVKVEF
jgi:hypothetical protein